MSNKSKSNTNRHGFKRIRSNNNGNNNGRQEQAQQIKRETLIQIKVIIPEKRITLTPEQREALLKVQARNDKRRQRQRQDFDRIIHPRNYRRNEREQRNAHRQLIRQEKQVHLSVSIKEVLEVK